MNIKNIRNIGICAHIDAGKTTLTERILFYSGKNYKIGEVHDGKATMDFMKQEQERGITISSACTTVFWKGICGILNNHKVNIIDTPGHVDFTVEVERSMRVLDGVCMLFCGVAGVQPQTENIYRQISKYKVPRIAFINKLDRNGSNFELVVKDIEKKLNCYVIKLNLPIFKNKKFCGILDLIDMKEIYFTKKNGEKVIIKEISNDLKKKAKDERKNLIEKLSMVNEDFMEKYLSNSNLKKTEIINFLRKEVVKCNITPLLCGSAFKNIGVQCLMDYIIHLLPSPKDKKIIGFVKNKKTIIKSSKNEYFSSIVFKITNDIFLGQIVFIRIYSGKVSLGDFLINYRNKEKVRIGRILQINADKKIDIKYAKSGDIVAITGFKKINTGDTLCKKNENINILLENISFPEPVISTSLIPLDKSEQEKLIEISNKLSKEDPSIRISTDKINGNIIVSGMGELHLEIFKDRIIREYGVNIESSLPSVSYKERILKKCKSEGKFIRQSGGRGQYGHVIIKLYPRKLGKGYKFINKIKGGVIPNEYISSINKGISESCYKGGKYGYPIVDLKVILLDGSFHEVDSNENAFKIAGAIALKEAINKIGTSIIEPIMYVNIETPKIYIGNIIGNLVSKRGNIILSEENINFSTIKALVPLNEMFNFSTTLRSVSQGRSNYFMKFSNYKKLPLNLYDKI
ncbi:elongation factor G [Candidatus Vidania fulgoroideorum]